MHKRELQNTITPLEAVEKVKQNTHYQYKWFVVKGKNDCIFELGGRNYQNNLELKAYIPKFDENGDPVIYSLNDTIQSNFAIVTGSYIHSNNGFETDYDTFIKVIKKDVRKFRRETMYKTVTIQVPYTVIHF